MAMTVVVKNECKLTGVQHMQSWWKILALATLITTNAYADGFTASVGTDYSTGKYGSSESTDVFYMPFVAKYTTGAYSFKVIVPYIRVTGPGDIIPGGFGGSGAGSAGATGTIGCPGDSQKGRATKNAECASATSTSTTTTITTSARKTESGLGDIVASATYNAFDGGDQGFVVDLSGRIKFATASDTRGLGSGENDYALQTNIDKNFGPAYASFGLGYKWLGEPSGVSYKNVVYGSFGGGYKFSTNTELGASYDWATAAVSGSSMPQEISVYASHRINDQYKLSGVLYGGLTDSSPDVGGGFTLSYYF